ncbi:ABC transporter permease [Salinicoccus carnicancri]|uniref:ABC transporter permease n=1 Tax=Salinicoccus carnicancri TaxID=558170 RepID=UPI0003118C98|nr:ABC transporter permease [Salinicoccus carnicancri]
MNTGRIMAIFEKDLKEFTRNMMLFTTTLIPILMAFMFRNAGPDSTEAPAVLIAVIIGTAYSTILCSSIMTMMAEENEKDTLRGLVQSPASMLDILTGKSLVVIMMTGISLGLSILVMDAEMSWGTGGIAALVLLGLFFLSLGIAVGLEVKSVATTSVYLLPIMLVFGFTPMIETIVRDESHIVRQVAEYLPVYQYVFIQEGTEVLPLLILCGWAVLGLIYAAWAFKKRMNDENK